MALPSRIISLLSSSSAEPADAHSMRILQLIARRGPADTHPHASSELQDRLHLLHVNVR